MMLLTEWGFDVMVHDPDAYIIKDPLQMYNDVIKAKDPHIISQKGIMPRKAKLKWGFSLVLGAVLYRSSPKLRKSPNMYTVHNVAFIYMSVCTPQHFLNGSKVSGKSYLSK